jgi:hypothetical protein
MAVFQVEGCVCIGNDMLYNFNRSIAYVLSILNLTSNKNFTSKWWVQKSALTIFLCLKRKQIKWVCN